MNTPTLVRRGALASLVGGLLFFPYALSKPIVTARIEAIGWHLPGLTVDATNQLFHAFEAVPVLLMAVGVVALATGYEGLRHGSGRAGAIVALVGFASMTVFHWVEHLFPDATVSLAVASVNVFEAGYYAGWATTNLGLFVCGVVLSRSLGRTGTVGRALVLPLPLAMAGGGWAVMTGAYTFAGTHRLVAAGTWVLVGALLLTHWRPGRADPHTAPTPWTRTDGGTHDRPGRDVCVPDGSPPDDDDDAGRDER